MFRITENRNYIAKEMYRLRDVNFDKDEYDIWQDILKEIEDDDMLQKSTDMFVDDIKEFGINKILCIADGDADGVSGATIWDYFVEHVSGNRNDIRVIVNNRGIGYGVHDDLIDYLYKEDVYTECKSIITVDHGINSVYDRLEDNFKIYITDHHISDTDRNDKFPIVNPHYGNSKLNTNYSGATVFYVYLREVLRKLDKDVDSFDRVARGIAGLSAVADMMDMRDTSNRFLYRRAIEDGFLLMVNRFYNRVFNRKEAANSDFISRGLAPVINSGWRMGEQYTAYRALASRTEEEAGHFFGLMRNINSKRLERMFTALRKVDNKKVDGNVVLFNVDMDKNIAGIVASMVGNKHNKPALILVPRDGGVLAGSGRGIVNGYDFITVINKCKEAGILVAGGGHKMAAGISIKKEDFNKLKDIMEEVYTENRCNEVDVSVKADIFVDDIYKCNSELYREIHMAGPFGNNYPTPNIAVNNPVVIKDMDRTNLKVVDLDNPTVTKTIISYTNTGLMIEDAMYPLGELIQGRNGIPNLNLKEYIKLLEQES